MARTRPLQRRFDRGMRQDESRDSLPDGFLWNAIDVIPGLGAKLRERGGWGNASNDIAATVATATYVIGGLWAPFTAGAKNLAVDEDGNLVTVASNGTVTNVGAFRVVAQNPIFHRNIAIGLANDGTTAPRKYDGSAIALLGGSPPAAKYGTVYKDRTYLALNHDLFPSGAGNPESYDTTNSLFEFGQPITGVASLRGAIVIFGEDTLSTLVGSTPPSAAGGLGDFRQNDPLFDVGCTDARSIATWGDKIVFANPSGIYLTDGASFEDLTAVCGMKNYWASLAIQSTWNIAGGIIRDNYVFDILNGSSFVDAGRIDLRRLTYWRLANLDAVSMWPAIAASEELYFGRRGAARVGKLASIFSPSSTVKNDGDGDAVAAVLETGYYHGEEGRKKWDDLYVRHHLEDHATDNPTVTVSYVTTPEATSYTNLPDTLSENTAEDRVKVRVREKSDGIAFKLTRANAGDWRLNGLDVEALAQEQSR